jgi:hypothetical protein
MTLRNGLQRPCGEHLLNAERAGGASKVHLIACLRALPSPATFPRDLDDPDFGPDLRSREGQVQAMALQIQPG